MLFLAETFMMRVNVFYITRNEILVRSDKAQRYFPESIDMTLQKWVIFILGVFGEISHFFPDPAEILFLVI